MIATLEFPSVSAAESVEWDFILAGVEYEYVNDRRMLVTSHNDSRLAEIVRDRARLLGAKGSVLRPEYRR